MIKKHYVNGNSIYALMNHFNVDSLRKVACIVKTAPQTVVNCANGNNEHPWVATESTLQRFADASGWPLKRFSLGLVSECKFLTLHRTTWEIDFLWNEKTTHIGMFRQRKSTLHFESPASMLYLTGRIDRSGETWASGELTTKKNGTTLIDFANFIIEVHDDSMKGLAIGTTIDQKIMSLTLEGRKLSGSPL